MANPEHITLLQKGTQVWNTWRKQNPSIRPDFSYAHLQDGIFKHPGLQEANLCEANFTEADLMSINLAQAKLCEADFSGANLSCGIFYNADLSQANLFSAYALWTNFSSANLYKANLGYAIFRSANLLEANLRGSNLCWAILDHAELHFADLSETIVGGTSFGDRSFRYIKGLETIIHEEHSPLSINSLFLSFGTIPEVFIEGTGAPKNFLTILHSIDLKKGALADE